MRPNRLSLVLLALLLAAALAPARAKEASNNVLLVDSDARAPVPDLLGPDEAERIERLQEETVTTLPISPVSPDDRTVLTITGAQLAFLDIQSGATAPISPERFATYSPLPLAGFSSFSWLDGETIGALAVDFSADRPEEAFVKLRISRATLEVRAEPIGLPPNTGIVSVAPSIDRFLLALLPPSEEDDTLRQTLRVRVRPPAPAAAAGEGPLELPPALQRGVELALASPARAALPLLQDGEDDEVDVTPERLDLALFERGRPEPRYVTTIPVASARLGDAWSADSARLAVSFYGVADPRRARPFFDGALLSEEVYRDVTGNLPPAGNPILQNNNTYLVEFASGATQVLRPTGEAPPLLGAHGWSPDGATLLLKAWHPARLRGRAHPIYTPQFSERSSFRLYDLGLREVGRLESDLFSGGVASRAQAQFVSPDEIIFQGVGGVNRHPYYYNRVSGELRNLADRAGSYWNLTSAAGSRQIVFMFTSFTEPPEIYRMGWDGKGLARLTWRNEELRLFAGLRQDPVSFTLRGGRREGVLIQPADAPFPPRGRPIVVWQEGGPGPAMLNRWQANVENPYALLPGMGVALLVTPVAGRPGYTPATYNALADGANFGALDIDEQAEIVRQLIGRGWTARGKVGITGCSYGGYFVAQSIVRHPDLYAAANIQCGWVDLFTEWSRGYDRLLPYLAGLPPYNAPEEYRRDSPAYNVGRVRAAVLTFHGTNDFLPVVQNENFHLQLLNRGLDARMVKFAGEGHGLSDPANQRYAAQELLVWFRDHLGQK
jgi:dipeptidyl aminopeptidase/acylaminoacyl peptidase